MGRVLIGLFLVVAVSELQQLQQFLQCEHQRERQQQQREQLEWVRPGIQTRA